jgi:Ca2+-binding RTX toxin-like protein
MKAKSKRVTTFFGRRSGKITRRGLKPKFGGLGVESLERREMMAANLAADTGLSFGAHLLEGGRPTEIAGPVNPGAGSGTVGSGTVAASGLHNQALGQTTGTFQIPPPPPPVLGATFENGVLTVTGSHAADHLFFDTSNGAVRVREVVKELTLLSVPARNLTAIVVNANAGDDWVKIDESITVPATIRGDWDNDTVEGGGGADNLYGGPGNDKLLGHGGNDLLKGDHGDDLLIGGDGTDVVYGGYGNDYLVGGSGNDWLMGEDGDDKIFGEDGNDLLFGGAGQNLIDGGSGDDMLYGGDDADAIYGGDGNDFLRGFAGDDRLRGEGGNDDIKGDAGDDVADGGIGNDFLAGDAGNDALSGGDGNDSLGGGANQDWLDGANGNDSLYGGAGGDWLQGGRGTDSLSGGAGDNKVYQDYAPGYQQLGQTTQALSWGDIGDAISDFVVDVWDGISDTFKWALDKAETIGQRVYDWATHIDDRLFRLGGDLAHALTNWPWEAEFWKDMGRALVDTLEVFGLGEAWEIATEILKPWQRGMTSEEIAVARTVFGVSIPYDRVRIDEFSLMAGIGRTHVTGYIINSTRNIDDDEMIHELTHVWQYVNDGLVYIPEAIDAQAGEGYEYGGLADLRAKMAAGQGLSAYNREQQGEIVKDYFNLRQLVRQNYEAVGLFAPLALRQNLDVYIHFVEEVSTLSAAELDTPDPSRPGRGVVLAGGLSGATAIRGVA